MAGGKIHIRADGLAADAALDLADELAPITHLARDLLLPENSKQRLDERLDEAIAESFPASDSIAVFTTR